MLGEFIDRNRYSVPAHWANTVVSVRLTADCVRIVAEAQMIAEHARCFGRDQLSCDPWHYLPILEKSQVQSGMVRRLIEATKPKALDNSLLSIPALTLEPLADCARYDSLRRLRHVH